MRWGACAALLVSSLAPACEDRYVIVREPASPPPEVVAAAETEVEAVTADAHVLVTADKNLGRPTAIVGVLDFHSRAESEDKGFDELRARAASLGADAVIGAEFEHGEHGEPSHLSGIAVRYR